MIETKQIEISQSLQCYHCGEDCKDDSIRINEKLFCCLGCKSVYEMLNTADLCNYYDYNQSPGKTRKENIKRDYEYLDNPEVIEKLIDFTNSKFTSITFKIPNMHCSSCIWILENLYKLNPGVIFSRVDFPRKTLELKFMNLDTNLKEIVILLDSIGYEPEINYSQTGLNTEKDRTKNLYYKLGIAGFAFGNVMLLSFPEYLGISEGSGFAYNVFGFINIILALPVLLFSSNEYFISAFKGLRKKIVNIDVPIALGIIVLFARSVFEIVSGTGAGYFDSMTGLVFFLLTGKLFQNKTYDTLDFERDYKSYFPIAVNRIENGKTIPTAIDKLKINDRILVRNQELIPADSILMSNNALIDYSFVTGENDPVSVSIGDKIYAGGKLSGSNIEIELVKEVSNSYLTQLWNNPVFTKPIEHKLESLTTTISKYFTFVVVGLATGTFIYWMSFDSGIAFNAFTAVLIVACPCALALSAPFTLGNTLRIFGRNKFYLKNTSVIETLSGINKIIFDKTGTLTSIGKTKLKYSGKELSENESLILKSLVVNSSHPKSRIISESLVNSQKYFTISYFKEIPGKGISGIVDNKEIFLGSSEFIKKQLGNEFTPQSSQGDVILVIENEIKGFYHFTNSLRDGLETLLDKLNRKYKLGILSGDSEESLTLFKNIFSNDEFLEFRKSPLEKLERIEEYKSKGNTVLMIGDGLNDAGALKAGDVGIAVTENANNFTPASDGIIDSSSLILLDKFLSFSGKSVNLIKVNFVISFIYNIIGLTFAVSGSLSPIIAAILMPLSSISVVIFSVVSTNLSAKKIGL